MAVSPTPAPGSFHRLTLTHLWLGLGLLGLGARIAVMDQSIGSNDMLTWQRFARWVSEEGLGYVYD